MSTYQVMSWHTEKEKKDSLQSYPTPALRLEEYHLESLILYLSIDLHLATENVPVKQI